jgi:hypothetical protein
VAHALTHLGAALALAPTEERVVAAIEKAASERPLLEHVEDQPFIGNVLLRAWLLRRGGRIDEALDLLAQLVQSFPNHRFETIAATWLVAARVSGAKVSDDAVAHLMGSLVFVGESTIGIHVLQGGERELLSGYEALADVLLEGGGNPNLPWVAAGVYRRLGLTKKALAALDGVGGYFGHIQRGLALRASGDARGALVEFTAAGQMPDATTSDTLERVRCHFALDDFDAALELLDGVAVNDDPELLGLIALCKARVPVGTPLAGVAKLDRLRRQLHARALICPPDATANILVQNGHQFEVGKTKLSMAISGWESPSNRLLIALYAAGTSDTTNVEMTMTEPTFGERNPRAQSRGAPAATWKWVNDVPVQRAPAPPASLRARLADLAGDASTGLLEIDERAGAVAAELTCSPAELMAAMVHAPEGASFLSQLPHGLVRYQQAAACVLARRPWAECGPALESLIYGPIDWSSAAAIDALALRVRREAEGAREGLELLISATRDLLPHDCEPRALSLAHALNWLPGVPREAKARVEEWWRAHRARPDDSDAEQPAPQERRSASPVAAPPAAGGTSGWVIVVVVIAVALLWLALK